MALHGIIGLLAQFCGVAGKRRCAGEDGMRTAERAFHYVVLTIARDIELCTRKVDGTLLEELDVAPPGKDFASYLSATLTKK